MEDSEIITLYWNRDERAIAETGTKYGPFCQRIAQNILTVREDAEECVSDTYQQAWTSIPPLRPQRLRPWWCATWPSTGSAETTHKNGTPVWKHCSVSWRSASPPARRRSGSWRKGS